MNGTIAVCNDREILEFCDEVYFSRFEEWTEFAQIIVNIWER